MARAANKTKEKAEVGPALSMPNMEEGNVKAAIAAVEAGKGPQLHMIPPQRIKLMPGFNVRVREEEADYAEDLEALKNSIKTEGFYITKPLSGIVGKDGDKDVVYLTDGHRRLEATMAAIGEGAEVTSVPVILKPSGTSMVDLTVALVKENTGRRLSALSNAIVVKRLLKHGLTDVEIAERLGYTKRLIDDYVLLINSPRSVREAVRYGRLSGTEAIRILRKHGKDNQAKAVEEIAEMVDRAAAKGKTRASRKDTDDAPVKRSVREERKKREEEDAGGYTSQQPPGEEVSAPRKRMQTVPTATVGLNAGDEFKLAEFRPWTMLFADWYALSENSGYGIASYDVEFNASMKRPKQEDAPEKKEPAEEAADAMETEDEVETEAETAEEEEDVADL